MRNNQKNTKTTLEFLGSSFRDPAGYLFTDEKGEIYRQINLVGKADYDLLMNSGLYKELTAKQMLVNHKEEKLSDKKEIYKVIKKL
ncbi:MAG: hypothetical protein WCP03_04450 [Candidatus Saccharibacteria bacterium]